MGGEDTRAWVAQTRSGVRQARLLITTPSPQTLDRCRPLLEEATACLVRVRDSLNRAGQHREPALLTELTGLEQDVAGLGLLLEHAAGFYSGWIRLRNSLAGGYTAQGKPAEPGPSRRVSVEG